MLELSSYVIPLLAFVFGSMRFSEGIEVSNPFSTSYLSLIRK